MLSMIMGLFGGAKFNIWLYVGIGVAVLGAVSYHFYSVNSLNSELKDKNELIGVMRTDLEVSKENQRQLEGALVEQQQSLRLVESQRKIDQQKINKLTKQYNKSRKSVTELRKLLSRHDLTYLAAEKPGLIENRINKGTKGVGERLGDITKPEDSVND